MFFTHDCELTKWALYGFAAVGAAVVLRLVLSFLGFVYQYYLSSASVQKYKRAGKWAVITGGGDGIGRALSVELAKRGFNICVIGRTVSKLEEVVEQAKKRGTEGKPIAFDFSNADDAKYAALFQQLDALEIGVLVNNVGINYEMPMDIDEAAPGYNAQILKVNCESQIRMTEYVVPKMKAKRCGAILNLSSISCRTPTPMLAVYGATKGFNKSLSEALNVELKQYGIDVTAVTPSFVVSNMSQRKRPSFDCPSAPAMAYQTINQLGRPLSWGHRHHAIIGGLMQYLPLGFLNGKMLALNKQAKKAVLRRKAREEAKKSATQ